MRIGVLTMAAVLIGCGGNDGVQLDRLSSELSRAYCEKAIECCTQQELSNQFPEANPPVTDQALCEATNTQIMETFLSAIIRTSQASGRLRYRPRLASACVERVRELPCGNFAAARSIDQVCQSFVAPQQQENAPCSWDEECTTRYCEGDRLAPNRDGVCKPMPTAGQPCPDGVCASGLFCTTEQDGGVCQSRRLDQAACWEDDECASGACNGEDTQNEIQGMCGPPMECNGL